MIRPTQRARRSISVAVMVIALVGLLGSCSEDPTAQNAIVAPSALPGVTFHDTTIYANRDSTFLTRLAMDGDHDLVGNANGYTATTLLAFYGPSPIDTAVVTSATLRLYVNYHLGPLPASVTFTIHKITSQWDPATITWDSVQAGGRYDPSSPYPPVTVTVTSDTQFVDIALDTALVRKWVQTPDSADVDRFGIALVPAGISNAIIGLHSFTSDSAAFLPTLTVLTQGPNTAVVDTTNLSSGRSTFVGDGPAPTDPEALTLQSGVAYRSWIGFDVSFLQKGVIINSAQLMVDKMTTPAFNAHLSDSTVSAHLVIGTTLDQVEGAQALLSPVTGSTTSLSGDARHIVQSWLHNTNYGVLLRTSVYSEFGSFDRFQLYGIHTATVGLRPRLHIVYSVMSLEKKP